MTYNYRTGIKKERINYPLIIGVTILVSISIVIAFAAFIVAVPYLIGATQR